MTVTNTSGGGNGIRVRNAKVELMDVALKGCDSAALLLLDSTSETTLVATRCEFANSGCGTAIRGSLTSATFKNCVFKDNENDGIFVSGATVHFHGEATAIHSNGDDGIYVTGTGKVIFHLTSDHNTLYNNGRDRFTTSGGTITNVED